MRFLFLIIIFLVGCQPKTNSNKKVSQASVNAHELEGVKTTGVSLVVLGTVQDAGAPQIGCTKSCCAKRFNTHGPKLQVVSLGIVDHDNQKRFLFEATPDIPQQFNTLHEASGFGDATTVVGIFLTHAHIGHYTGLMYLGREAMNAKQTPVYVMPKMKQFLENNGPWEQLVNQQNIKLKDLLGGQAVSLSEQLQITPIQVPHRDEYSETVGFIIQGPNKKVLFIPDIDKWERWDTPIENIIAQVDHAFLDATFYDSAEIGHRNISEIPHPFIIESMNRFDKLPKSEKAKIHFIHFNHTNPVLDTKSTAREKVLQNGYHISEIGGHFFL